MHVQHEYLREGGPLLAHGQNGSGCSTSGIDGEIVVLLESYLLDDDTLFLSALAGLLYKVLHQRSSSTALSRV